MSKPRRRHTAEQKAELLRQHVAEKKPVSEVCNEAEIQPSLFYTWQRELLAGAHTVFSTRRAPSRENELEAKISRLEARVARNDIHDRALGAFLGLAVGDAVGTTLEFCSRDTQPRLWAARRWPRLRPLPHPLRFCAGTATSSQPSTMAARTGVQADLRRRRTSVSSLCAWRGRTRRGDIRACEAHSRT